MSKHRPDNVAASVRQKLLNKARGQGEDFNFVLTRYALERILYRLSQSSHCDRFILKGATLFQIWSGHIHRPTRDLDFLGYGSPSPDEFEDTFRDICQQTVEDDGLRFNTDTIHAEQIKEEEEYEGLRLKLEAYLASARIPIQIDIGFGDAVTPGPEEITFPTLLHFPAPNIRAYPRETVIAEKYQAMVMLGIANSRMKDFFDIWTLARQFAFSGTVLCDAIQATFQRRQTPILPQKPLALTSEFTEDAQKDTQWNAFLRKNNLDNNETSLSDIAAVLTDFLMPPTHALSQGTRFDQTWRPPKGWSSASR